MTPLPPLLYEGDDRFGGDEGAGPRGTTLYRAVRSMSSSSSSSRPVPVPVPVWEAEALGEMDLKKKVSDLQAELAALHETHDQCPDLTRTQVEALTHTHTHTLTLNPNPNPKP